VFFKVFYSLSVIPANEQPANALPAGHRARAFLLASGTFSALFRPLPRVTFNGLPIERSRAGAGQCGHPRQVNANGWVEGTSLRDRRSLERAHGPVNHAQAILATDSEQVGITLHSLPPRLPLLRKKEDNLPRNVIRSIKLQGDLLSSVW